MQNAAFCIFDMMGKTIKTPRFIGHGERFHRWL